MWLEVLFTFVVGYFSYLIYFFCYKPYNYWKDRGIVYEVPLPLVGNFKDVLFRRKAISDVCHFLYKKHSNKRYLGIYIFRKPALLVRDIDLLKKICVEAFDNFSDRVRLFDNDLDTAIGENLANLKGKEWNDTRTTITSAFSTLAISKYFDILVKYARSFTNHFVKDNEDFIEIQLRDVFSKFESDVVSSLCFGVENNSLENTENEFFQRYKKIKRFGALEKLKLCFTQLFPRLSKFLNVKVIEASTTDFFKILIKETIKNRKSGNINRNDFIQYLIEVNKGAAEKREGTLKEELNETPAPDIDQILSDIDTSVENQGKYWSEDEIAIQALIFLISHVAVEVFLTLGSCMAYELALNPDVQVKVQEEIDNVLQVSDGANLSYESVAKMKYLDCVVSESLRKWPPLYQLNRQCVKQFIELDASLPDEEKIVIAEGTAIIVPVMAIHRDPQYFPEPDKFNPERFNEENAETILPGSYIPFGTESRNCIGSKLAVLEIKLLFFFLLSKFDLVLTHKADCRPNEMNVNSIINTHLGLKPRKVTSL